MKIEIKQEEPAMAIPECQKYNRFKEKIPGQ